MFARNLLSFRQKTLNKLLILKERFVFPEKWKGGRVHRWGMFWQDLFLDYANVAKDVVQEAKSKPLKAALIASGIGVMHRAIVTNPSERDFNDSLVNCITSLATVGELIRNPASEQHIQYLIRCQNQGLLRTSNLIFFSLVWVADYSTDVDIYAAHCKYLKPKYATFYQRIIDVGIFGTWWNLKRKMIDYDINPSEREEMR